MKDIKHVRVAADSVVFTSGKHIIGWELSDSQGKASMYDSAALTTTAALKADTLRGTAYYKRAHIMFPLPGLKLSSGLYISCDGWGEVIVYYTDEVSDQRGSILYKPISEASVTISTQPCELIGGDIWSGVISCYDGADATAAQLVMTLRTGSYFFYGNTILPEPIKCNNGLYIAGASGKGEIFYRLI